MDTPKRVTYGATALVVALAFSACADSPTEPDQSAWTDTEFDFTGDLIAFETQRDGNREIYVMKPDGSDGINVTNNAAPDGDAAWSPDGSKIAFASTRDGNTEIYVMDVDGSNVIATDGRPGHRPLSELVAGRQQDRLRLGPGRKLGDLRDGRRRSGPAAPHGRRRGGLGARLARRRIEDRVLLDALGKRRRVDHGSPTAAIP